MNLKVFDKNDNLIKDTLNPDRLNNSVTQLFNTIFSDFKILKGTGKLDKAKREIFEDDICYDCELDEIGYVAWSDEEMRFMYVTKGEWEYFNEACENLVIIGNKNVNKELYENEEGEKVGKIT